MYRPGYHGKIRCASAAPPAELSGWCAVAEQTEGFWVNLMPQSMWDECPRHVCAECRVDLEPDGYVGLEPIANWRRWRCPKCGDVWQILTQSDVRVVPEEQVRKETNG